MLLWFAISAGVLIYYIKPINYLVNPTSIAPKVYLNYSKSVLIGQAKFQFTE